MGESVHRAHQGLDPDPHRESAQAQANDADGKPIEIAAEIVWQVRDTTHAVYSVDDFTQFVTIQAETAARTSPPATPTTTAAAKGSPCATTPMRSPGSCRPSSPCGSGRPVDIIESRLTRLSYAAEIAQAMLRQQQASAVVGARQRIVEGAVGMVQLARQRLHATGVVELDEERKATMVSNLFVVLCRRAGNPARRQHRHALPVTVGHLTLTPGTGRGTR